MHWNWMPWMPDGHLARRPSLLLFRFVIQPRDCECNFLALFFSTFGRMTSGHFPLAL